MELESALNAEFRNVVEGKAGRVCCFPFLRSEALWAYLVLLPSGHDTL